jgi:hypothetical protein
MDQSYPITQKIRKTYPSPLEVALIYYQMVAIMNGIHLTTRQLQLVAFTAVKGSISAGGAREEFIKMFKSSRATVNNMISDLQKDEMHRLLVKSGGRAGKITVNPRILLDFSKPLEVQINLTHAASRQAD